MYLSVASFSAYLVFNSGNTFSGPQDPFKEQNPRSFHEQIRELSLKNVGFLQESVTGKNGNLSWEFVSNPYCSNIYHLSR